MELQAIPIEAASRNGWRKNCADFLPKRNIPKMDRSPGLPQTSKVLVMSLAGFFQFWEGQEEHIYRRYLQIASYIREKERAQPASRMGEDRYARALSLASRKIGKDET